MGQLVSPPVFGYDPDIGPPDRNLAQARQLLAAAGLPQGFDATLEMSTPSAPYAPLLAAQLAEAGVRTRIVERTWEELYPRLIARKADFFFVGLACDTGDATDLFDGALHTRSTGKGFGAHNFMGYSNPELDRLVEKSGQSLSPVERLEMIKGATHLAMDELPLIPLWVSEVLYGVRREIDWQPRLDRKILAYNIRREARPPQ